MDSLLVQVKEKSWERRGAKKRNESVEFEMTVHNGECDLVDVLVKGAGTVE